MVFVSIIKTEVYGENIEISLLILQKYGFCLNYKNRIYDENIDIFVNIYFLPYTQYQ